MIQQQESHLIYKISASRITQTQPILE